MMNKSRNIRGFHYPLSDSGLSDDSIESCLIKQKALELINAKRGLDRPGYFHNPNAEPIPKPRRSMVMRAFEKHTAPISTPQIGNPKKHTAAISTPHIGNPIRPLFDDYSFKLSPINSKDTTIRKSSDGQSVNPSKSVVTLKKEFTSADEEEELASSTDEEVNYHRSQNNNLNTPLSLKERRKKSSKQDKNGFKKPKKISEKKEVTSCRPKKQLERRKESTHNSKLCEETHIHEEGQICTRSQSKDKSEQVLTKSKETIQEEHEDDEKCRRKLSKQRVLNSVPQIEEKEDKTITSLSDRKVSLGQREQLDEEKERENRLQASNRSENGLRPNCTRKNFTVAEPKVQIGDVGLVKKTTSRQQVLNKKKSNCNELSEQKNTRNKTLKKTKSEITQATGYTVNDMEKNASQVKQTRIEVELETSRKTDTSHNTLNTVKRSSQIRGVSESHGNVNNPENNETLYSTRNQSTVNRTRPDKSIMKGDKIGTPDNLSRFSQNKPENCGKGRNETAVKPVTPSDLNKNQIEQENVEINKATNRSVDVSCRTSNVSPRHKTFVGEHDKTKTSHAVVSFTAATTSPMSINMETDKSESVECSSSVHDELLSLQVPVVKRVFHRVKEKACVDVGTSPGSSNNLSKSEKIQRLNKIIDSVSAKRQLDRSVNTSENIIGHDTNSLARCHKSDKQIQTSEKRGFQRLRTDQTRKSYMRNIFPSAEKDMEILEHSGSEGCNSKDSDSSKVISDYEEVLLYQSLPEGALTSTNFSSRENTVDQILAHNSKSRPWRLSSDGLPSSTSSSVRLNFLRSLREIEEDRLRQQESSLSKSRVKNRSRDKLRDATLRVYDRKPSRHAGEIFSSDEDPLTNGEPVITGDDTSGDELDASRDQHDMIRDKSIQGLSKLSADNSKKKKCRRKDNEKLVHEASGSSEISDNDEMTDIIEVNRQLVAQPVSYSRDRNCVLKMDNQIHENKSVIGHADKISEQGNTKRRVKVSKRHEKEDLVSSTVDRIEVTDEQLEVVSQSNLQNDSKGSLEVLGKIGRRKHGLEPEHCRQKHIDGVDCVEQESYCVEKDDRIENNRVIPDIQYEHVIEDVVTVSQKEISQICNEKQGELNQVDEVNSITDLGKSRTLGGNISSLLSPATKESPLKIYQSTRCKELQIVIPKMQLQGSTRNVSEAESSLKLPSDKDDVGVFKVPKSRGRPKKKISESNAHKKRTSKSNEQQSLACTSTDDTSTGVRRSGRVVKQPPVLYATGCFIFNSQNDVKHFRPRLLNESEANSCYTKSFLSSTKNSKVSTSKTNSTKGKKATKRNVDKSLFVELDNTDNSQEKENQLPNASMGQKRHIDESQNASPKKQHQMNKSKLPSTSKASEQPTCSTKRSLERSILSFDACQENDLIAPGNELQRSGSPLANSSNFQRRYDHLESKDSGRSTLIEDTLNVKSRTRGKVQKTYKKSVNNIPQKITKMLTRSTRVSCREFESIDMEKENAVSEVTGDHGSRTSLYQAGEYLDLLVENQSSTFKYLDKSAKFNPVSENVLETSSLKIMDGAEMACLKILPGRRKQLQAQSRNVVTYFVFCGEGQIHVHDKISKIEAMTRFIVPMGVKYSIENGSEEEPLVLFSVKLTPGSS